MYAIEAEDGTNPGQIITFYSFKGGVGRTMSLANVAFQAAANGLRVLVMDWDLEAPGLAYYFRGMLEPSVAREVKEANGILNVLWHWVSGLQSATTSRDMETMTSEFAAGEPFDKCVRTLVDPKFFENGEGCLDHISAGSPRIHVPEETSYEDALARFPWHQFFDELAGGYVAESLRNWSKRSYDLVLIDSRTGLAEAAGLCTMQLPDTVAMCFVLNRQNIDGIARVASAIRARRGDEIKLCAVPMRVAREGTVEESEARARAISELTRVGGFSTEEVQHQMQSLAVRQADNVPFYETLSLVIAEDPALDPMTLNYVRLARELCGHPFAQVIQDPALIDLVRARLQPRMATAEFLSKLAGSEPLRAIEELQRLLGGAQEMVLERSKLESTYAQALVGAAFSVSDTQFLPEVADVQRQALDLLRFMRVSDETTWSPVLVDTLELHLGMVGPILDDDEEITVLEELDTLLASDASVNGRIRRASNRRKLAWVYTREGHREAALQANAEVSAQIKEVFDSTASLTAEQNLELLTMKVDMLLQRGGLMEQELRWDVAAEEYQACIRSLSSSPSTEMSSELTAYLAEAHQRLALIQDGRLTDSERIRHAFTAATLGVGVAAMSRFVDLVDMVIEKGSGNAELLEFLDRSLSPDRPRNHLVTYFSRTPRNATAFIGLLKRLALKFGPTYGPQSSSALNRLLLLAENVLIQIARRKISLPSRYSTEILDQFDELAAILKSAEFAWTPTDELQKALEEIRSASRRTPGTRR